MNRKYWDISMERDSYERIYRRALYKSLKVAHYKPRVTRVKSTKHGEWLLQRLFKVLDIR